MKRGPQQREDKGLSIKGLLKTVQGAFKEIKPSKKTGRGRPVKISISDILMSALAMFGMKSPSLLAFDQEKAKDPVLNNLKKLYGITNVPCDTYMREQLDEIDPAEIRGAFTALFSKVQRGNFLKHYRFLDDSYLMAIDGTSVFESENINCNNCCEKKHQDGSMSYYHQILCGVIIHPDYAQVLPFCPEPITKQDGAAKNDCELNATYRFLDDLKREHPQLPLTLTFDALFANAPLVNKVTKLGFDYIIVSKSSCNKSLFEWIEGADLCKTEFTVDSSSYSFRYINQIPLNDTKNAPLVNFFECTAIERLGKQTKEKKFSWITSHQITEKNIFNLMRGGRAKWKIENETFNTLKNQGYQFEHNFGHGKENLHTVFAFLMMLAFSIDQIQEATDGLFQKALKKTVSRRALWENMRRLFYTMLINSWEDMFQAIAFGYTVHTLAPNTS